MAINEMKLTVNSDVVPTDEEFLTRAKALVPMLRERASEIDKAGSVPEDVVQAFRDAGFYKMLQPKQWGGYEVNPLTFLQVLMEIGRGSGSAAWILMILGTHQWEFGLMDPKAGDDVWGEDNNVLVSSSYAPAGKATKVEGGYTLNGTWPTSSGCLNSKWAIIGTMNPVPGRERPEWTSHLVPLSDCEILDDWHVIGLQGTGSRSLKLDNVFVPNYRIHSLDKYELDDRNNIYLLPFRLFFWTVVASLLVGFGQGAIDTFLIQSKGKKRTGSPELLSDNARVKQILSTAQAQVTSARCRIETMVSNALSYVNRRELVPNEVIVKSFDISRTGEQMQQVALSLYNLLGPSIIYSNTPYQRVFRDIMVASVHPTQRFEMETDFIADQLFASVDAL